MGIHGTTDNEAAILGLSKRRARLYACAVCRHFRSVPQDVREALLVADKYADGQTSYKALKAAREAIRFKPDRYDDPLIDMANQIVAMAIGTCLPQIRLEAVGVAAGGAQASRLAHVNCNRVNPMAVLANFVYPEPESAVLDAKSSPLWPTVLLLAATAYGCRHWADHGALDAQRMGVLSDAVEEAGCDQRIVDHLHTRPSHGGYWSLDLILGNK